MNQYETDPVTRTIRAKIEGFLDYVEGNFRLQQVYEALSAKSADEKNAVRQGLHREKLAGTIEATGTYGVWRKIDRDIEWLDLATCQNSHIEKMDAKLPLGLETLVPPNKGDLIVKAGVTSTGKTSSALDFGYKNKDRGVLYFSSEVTLEQVRDKAEKGGIDVQSLSGIKFAIRYDDYQDVVEPGKINIIDYLQAPGSEDDPRYYAIPHLIKKIHEKMNGTGLLFICLQKDPGKRTGDGGFKTMHRGSLYLTLDIDDRGRYWANILKCKSRPALQGFRMEYEPGPFGLKPLSDWMPPYAGMQRRS